MGTIYARGKKLWLGFKDAAGEWVYRSSGYEVGQEKLAERRLAAVEKAIAEGAELPAGAGTPTVAAFIETWSSARIREGLSNAKREQGRLRRYVAKSSLGPMKLDQVELHHVKAWLAELRVKTWQREVETKGRAGRRAVGEPDRLAPRTIRATYGLLHSMFEAAVGPHIDVTPCRLKKKELPKKADKNPGWRHTAVFTRPEVELLISDERVPFHRRVAYALGFLAALRTGEIGPLRWRHLEERDQLDCLHVVASYNADLKREQPPKSGFPREVPVHPTLKRILAEWKLQGWPAMWGRAPKPDDLIVPNEVGKYRAQENTMDGARKDYATLGLRHRRFHDARRTFTSLARAGTADKAVLRWVTHGPENEQMVDVYTSLPWWALCDAVSKLKVGLLGAEVTQLRATGTVLQSVLQDDEGGGEVPGTAAADEWTRRESKPSGLGASGKRRRADPDASDDDGGIAGPERAADCRNVVTEADRPLLELLLPEDELDLDNLVIQRPARRVR